MATYGDLSEDDLVRRFSQVMTMTTAVKDQSAAAQQKQQPTAASTTAAFSPRVCLICRAHTSVGRYLGEGKWSVTCGRCHESFIVNQG